MQDPVPIRFVPTLIAAGATLLSASGSVAQDDPFEGKTPGKKDAGQAPADVVIQTEWIEVDSPTLSELLAQHPPNGPAGALRDALQKRLVSKEEGGAKLLQTAMVRTRSGRRAKVESVLEMIYPTELTTVEHRRGESPPVPVHLTSVDTTDFSAFETRNVGTTLEVDPVLAADGKTIDLNIAPEIVGYAGETAVQEIPFGDGFRPTVTMPRFYRMGTSLALSGVDGTFWLAGILTPWQDDGPRVDRSRKVLQFVRASVADPAGDAGAGDAGSVAGITVTADLVEMPTRAAAALLSGHDFKRDSSQLLNSVLKRVEKGEAWRLESHVVRTRSGQRAKSESLRETIYPTEFYSAHGRGKNAPPVPATVTSTDIASPCAFEVRNVGTTLEVDPVVNADGVHVDLNVAVEMVRYMGTRVIKSLPLPNGKELSDTTAPKFFTNRVSTSAVVRDGRPALLGTVTPPGDDGEQDISRQVLVFLTAKLKR